MSAPSVFQLAQSVTSHSWNKDRTKVALCPNTKEVWIFKKDRNNWTREHVLKEHDQIVTGIDWAPESNRIVTCGQDRNAYVWKELDNGTWKPTLVILRINRAATDVKWSPKEDKFAVASGAKTVSVCYFEKDNDWWVSKHIKKHRSTVLKIDWHPNNILLATASSDYTARVFSGFVRGVDKKPSATPYGTRLPFGELLAEYPCGGWVHAVKWSPDGESLAFIGHDCTLTVVHGESGESQVVKSNDLPLLDFIWANPSTIVGAGHNCFPCTYVNSGNGWAVGRNLDEKKGAQKKQVSQTRAAFNMFQSKVETGKDENKTSLQTKHQNQINCVHGFAGSSGAYTRCSTSGLDGKICVWAI